MRRSVARGFFVAGFITLSVAMPLRAEQTASARLSACTLLSRDLVEKYDTGNKRLLTMFKPVEEPIGPAGSSCEDGTIGFQINPFAKSDELRKSPGADWQPVSGVGDTAFFHNKANTFAELIVWTGRHHFTLQMGVPQGGLAESLKSKAMELGQAIVAKLR